MFETVIQVFQNRFNGTVDFYQDYRQYEIGFGDLDGEFWMGLLNILLNIIVLS